MPDTVEQPSNRPTSKVTAATGAGAASVLLVFIAGQFGLEVTPEAATAFTTLLVFAAGYFKRERKDP